MLAWCIISILTLTSSSSSSTNLTLLSNSYKVKLLRNSNNIPLCSVIVANFSKPARSRIECSSLCNDINTCLDFNFNLWNRRCQMYSYDQTSYNTINKCYGYKVFTPSGCRPIKNPIAVDGCAIPFTYNGNWYTNCTSLNNDACTSFCLDTSLVIRNCDYSLGDYGKIFVNQTYNISSKPVNLQSINKWILIQQRLDIMANFNYNYATYVAGFGDQKNFWLGLNTIYEITKNQNYMIRFEMKSTANKWYSAQYTFFYLDPPANSFNLRLGSYSGDAGDAMRLMPPNGVIVGYPFQTYETTSSSCQPFMYGGWWVNFCNLCHLNNRYDQAGWGTLPVYTVSMTRIYVKAFA